MNRGRVIPSGRYKPPVPVGVFADGEAVSGAERLQEVAAERSLAVEGRAISRSLAHRGYDEALDVSNQIEHPSDIGAPINLIAFTVPNGMIAVIRKVGVYYSEPTVPMTLAVGWRIAVNNYRVPYVFHTGGTEDYCFTSFGDVSNPLEIEELWVQANQTVAIQVRAFFTFNDHCVMVGRLSGRLYKPANPNIITVAGVV